MFEKCKSILNEIIGQGKLKDLLGQFNPGQEIEEKEKYLPIHMHINKDMVDFCYLTSAMLVEVLNIANPFS